MSSHSSLTSSLTSSHSSFSLSQHSHNSHLFEQFPTLNDDDDDGVGNGGGNDGDDDNGHHSPLSLVPQAVGMIGLSPSKRPTRLSLDSGRNQDQNQQQSPQSQQHLGHDNNNDNLDATTTTTTPIIIYGDYGDIPLDLTQPTSPLPDYDDVLSTHSSTGSILQDVLKPPALSFGSGGVDIDSEIVFMPKNTSNPTPPEHFLDNVNLTLDYGEDGMGGNEGGDIGGEMGQQLQSQQQQLQQQQPQQQQLRNNNSTRDGIVDQGLLNIQAFIQHQNSQGSPGGDDDREDDDDDEGVEVGASNSNDHLPRSRRHSLDQ